MPQIGVFFVYDRFHPGVDSVHRCPTRTTGSFVHDAEVIASAHSAQRTGLVSYPTSPNLLHCYLHRII
jgi:hypothetical protein